MLAGDGDRSGNGKRQGTAGANGVVQDRVDAPQKRASERRQAMLKQLMEGFTLIHAAHAIGAGMSTVFVFHLKRVAVKSGPIEGSTARIFTVPRRGTAETVPV